MLAAFGERSCCFVVNREVVLLDEKRWGIGLCICVVDVSL